MKNESSKLERRLLLPLDKIRLGRRLRETCPDAVTTLAASMDRIGLLCPIVVTATHVLVAGAHRLAAARSLGWKAIAATVLDIDERAAIVAEIDENLVRNELTALEQCEHLAERKRLYEEMHSVAQHGGARSRSTGQLVHLKPSFADATAEQIHESARNVRRSIAIASALRKVVRDQIRHLPIADNKQELSRLAKLDDDTQNAVAIELAKGAGSVKQAQRSIVARTIRAEAPPLPAGPFRVLVLDPPWDYSKRKNDPTHRSSLDYPSMSLEKIAALPVPELAHDDAVLWLWTTNAYLDGAHELVRGWGFVVKTVLTWAKDRPGLGDWLRGQTEHALLAVKGRPIVELGGESTLLTAKRREHSRKPEEFFALVESLCPGSKLELFARQPREGWTTWGAESEKFRDAG